jgi:hypothetical protein
VRVDDRRFGRNDDRQVRDGHPRAVEHQTLGRVSAGRTSEGVTLNAAYRRPIEANFRQEHLGAARQTFHICPWPPVADTFMKPTLRPRRGGTLPLWIAARKGLGALPATRASDLTYVESGPHRASTQGIEAAGTAILGGRLVRLAEAQGSWSNGGEAEPEEDCVTDYE